MFLNVCFIDTYILSITLKFQNNIFSKIGLKYTDFSFIATNQSLTKTNQENSFSNYNIKH